MDGHYSMDISVDPQSQSGAEARVFEQFEPSATPRFFFFPTEAEQFSIADWKTEQFRIV